MKAPVLVVPSIICVFEPMEEVWMLFTPNGMQYVAPEGGELRQETAKTWFSSRKIKNIDNKININLNLDMIVFITINIINQVVFCIPLQHHKMR
jgi:hypothetical protein